MDNKSKKGAKIAVNVIVTVIAVLVLIIAVNTLISGKKGYTSFFGIASYAVKTDSMEGKNKDSFNEGDIILVKVLKTEKEKASLKVGDVVTFWDVIDGKKQLNSHRIIKINTNTAFDLLYETKGDNVISNDPVPLDYREVVGVYQSKIPNLGKVTMFINSPTGFLIFIVIPSILVLIYCIYNFAKSYKTFAVEKATVEAKKEADANDYTKNKEKMRQEIMEELKKQALEENNKENNADDNKEKRD